MAHASIYRKLTRCFFLSWWGDGFAICKGTHYLKHGKIALKSQYFDLSNPGQCDGQVQVEGGRGSQSSCTLGIAGFPFGERPEVGVRGQGKMVKTTGSTIFTIGIIAANVMLSCSTIIIIKITGVAAIDHSHHCNCNHCHHRRQCHHKICHVPKHCHHCNSMHCRHCRFHLYLARMWWICAFDKFWSFVLWNPEDFTF